jgi:protein SCO1
LAVAIWLLTPLLFSACARRYRVDGLVLSVNPQEKTVMISHRSIPGYMEAMTMPFRVRRASELETLQPGDRVQFQLVVKRGLAHAEKLETGSEREAVRATDTTSLPVPEPKERLRRGDRVPDFALTNHRGHGVQLSDLRGKVVAVNFIYTRCPLPEVCPRLAAIFAQLQRRFQKQMGKDLVLLSITLDATHDTPEVLATYAARWGASLPAWHFLTGSAREIERVAKRFGLVYWPEEGLLTHTSQTAVVNREGRLAALVEGSSYEDQQLGDLIARQMEVADDAHSSVLCSARE